MRFIPKHKWERIYKEGNLMNALLVNTDPEEMPTTGPYILEKFVPDQRVVLKRNPYFYEFDKSGIRLPYLDHILYLITPDINALTVKFQNGEIDMTEVRPENFDLIKRWETEGNYTTYDLGPSYNTYYFQLNLVTKRNKDGTPFVAPHKSRLF